MLIYVDISGFNSDFWWSQDSQVSVYVLLVAGHVRFGNSEHFALAQVVLTKELADAKKREQELTMWET